MLSANNYQDEDSEKWVGEWIESRGVRDEIVLATKYASPYRKYVSGRGDARVQANYIGHNAKALRVSVEASLSKMRTDYIDLVRSLKHLSSITSLESPVNIFILFLF